MIEPASSATLAWMVSIVALFVPMAGDALVDALQPSGLSAPQVGLMKALSRSIVHGPWVIEMIRTVLFVVVVGAAGVVGIWVVVESRRRNRG